MKQINLTVKKKKVRNIMAKIPSDLNTAGNRIKTSLNKFIKYYKAKKFKSGKKWFTQFFKRLNGLAEELVKLDNKTLYHQYAKQEKDWMTVKLVRMYNTHSDYIDKLEMRMKKEGRDEKQINQVIGKRFN